jgi:hypothetical protein
MGRPLLFFVAKGLTLFAMLNLCEGGPYVAKRPAEGKQKRSSTRQSTRGCFTGNAMPPADLD